MAEKRVQLSQLNEAQGQEWFERTLLKIHQDKRQRKEMKDVSQVSFAREKFVEEVKRNIATNDPEGFVISLKRKRDFASDFCLRYPQLSSSQRLELLLALGQELGRQELPQVLEQLPLKLRAQLVLGIIAPSIAFIRGLGHSIFHDLKEVLIPPNAKFVKLVASVPQGARFLLDLRGQLVASLSDEGLSLTSEQRQSLQELNDTLQELFSTQQGVLISPISLSSASVVEFIIGNERVHPFSSWADVKRRICGKNRLMFGLFHANIQAPLCFVTIAMAPNLCANIQDIVEGRIDDTQESTHAVFYAISNPHRGLQGLNLASHLIFLSVAKIAEQFPSCQTYATLSPVPGFRSWLMKALTEKSEALFTQAQKDWILSLKQIGGGMGEEGRGSVVVGGVHFDGTSPNADVYDTMLTILELRRWEEIRSTCPAALKELLLQLCSRYLLFERRGKKIFDPVANFHISNGAHVERLNFAADSSRSGQAQSLGIMVNYKYDLEHLDVTATTFRKYSTVSAPKIAVSMLYRVNSPIFKALPREMIESFNVPLYARTYSPKKKIIERGSLSTAIFFISMGIVQIRGFEKKTLKTGDFFGEVEVLLDEPRRYDVVAETVCHVFMLLRSDFQRILEGYPELARKAKIWAADSSAPLSRI